MPNTRFSNSSVANSPDFKPVAIFFQDETINEIFSALLEVRGVPTCIIGGLEELDSEARIITEPYFFSRLQESQHDRCLVVGNKDVLQNIKALSLSRPLTEEKVEEALSLFLGK
jgi:hypothetical protein